MMIAEQPESNQEATNLMERHERRHFAHKRLERWIRLQQFVYGLPDDYAYAVCITEKNAQVESRALVSVGWMTWFGYGKGSDRQHSLALALLEASDALSSNTTRVFFHFLNRLVFRRLRLPQGKTPPTEVTIAETDKRLAG
jgi:hypothetical protein